MITREAPPVTVYAAPPPPPVIIGNAVGGIVAGALSLPFGILGAIFGPPQVPLVPNGGGGLVPFTTSRYDPYTGQFLPPGYYAPDATYAPERPRRPPSSPRSSSGACYSGDGSFIGDGNPDCAR
jgi:hypothetical protein